MVKKTRRGKRAGKNQKLRAEQMSLKRLSSDLGRPSLDLPTVSVSCAQLPYSWK